MTDKKLLQKFLDENCTPEEAARVHRFLADNGSDLSLLNEVLDESWEASAGEAADAGQSGRIITGLREQLYPARLGVIPHIRRYLVRYAAAVLFFVLGATLLWQQQKASVADSAMAITEWKTMTNTSSHTMMAVFPDSSKTWISPGSSIQYAAAFADGQRSVRLHGEAFFDVTHREGQPFTVQGNGIVTTVLGTAFNIEAYPKEATVRVSLVRGKVSVSDSNTAHPMQAGEMLTYNRQNGTVAREKLKVMDIKEWTNGYLILNDIPVSVALERIATRYHRTLKLNNGQMLEQRRITTLFKEETMDEMLKLLLFVTQHRYQDDGKTITILK